MSLYKTAPLFLYKPIKLVATYSYHPLLFTWGTDTHRNRWKIPKNEHFTANIYLAYVGKIYWVWVVVILSAFTRTLIKAFFCWVYITMITKMFWWSIYLWSVERSRSTAELGKIQGFLRQCKRTWTKWTKWERVRSSDVISHMWVQSFLLMFQCQSQIKRRV